MSRRRPNASWLAKCAAKREEIIDQIDELRALGLTRREIVASLNKRGILTMRGELWTANNLTQVEHAFVRALVRETSQPKL